MMHDDDDDDDDDDDAAAAAAAADDDDDDNDESYSIRHWTDATRRSSKVYPLTTPRDPFLGRSRVGNV